MKDIVDLEKFWELIGEKNVKVHIKDISKFSYVPFIGSGMSVPFGYPNWSNFLSKIIDNFFEVNERQRYTDLLKNEKFLELADKLNDNLGNGVIEEQVRNEFCLYSVEKVKKDRNYLSLLKSNPSIKTFVTTNFDPVIETYLGFSEDKVYLPSNMLHCNDILDNIRYGKKCIIKLHGTASKPESIILTGKTFRSMYKQENTTLQELIDYLWNKSVFLFLGCGLKSDYLIEYFQTLASSKKTNWHYAILPYPSESELIKRRRELINLKIRPIWYENGKYEQIFTILGLITGNYSFLNTLKDYDKLEKNQEDCKFNTSSDLKDEKNLSEPTLIINNGNVGTQKTLNIKYLNGNITL